MRSSRNRTQNRKRKAQPQGWAFPRFRGLFLHSELLEQIRPSIERGRYDDALPLLQKLLAASPSHPLANFWMANALYLTGRSDADALRHYDAAESAGHPIGAVALYRGILLAERGDYAAAQQAFQHATTADPTSAYALSCLEQTHRILYGSTAPADFYYPPPHVPHLTAQWLEGASIPQSQQFMIDCLPVLRDLFRRTPASHLDLLDVGTASGGGANVLATLFCGTIFGKTLQVDAIDLIRRYQAYARHAFPRVRYLCGDLFQYEPQRIWDITVCSHTIEHMYDPTPLIRHCQQRARSFSLFYAPFEEDKLIPGHLRSIRRDFVESLQPLWWEVATSPGWQHPEDALSRTVLFVLEGKA